MSSELNYRRAFHYGLKQAWHGLTKVRTHLTGDEFPKVERMPLFYQLPDGKVRRWEGRDVPATLDDGLPVGEASGESYTVFEPREAVAYLKEVLAGTRYTVSSLGMLGENRGRWFVTIHLDELEAISRPGEAFELSLTGGLDKSLSPMLNVGHTTIVCWNTMQIARAAEALFASKLTSGFRDRLAASKAAVERLVGMAAVFNRTLSSLETLPAKADDSRAVYAAEIAGTTGLNSARSLNIVDELVHAFQSGRGNSGKTRLDTLNGFTEVFSSGTLGNQSKKDVFSRWASSEFGSYADRKVRFQEAVSTDWDGMVKRGNEVLADLRRKAVTVA